MPGPETLSGVHDADVAHSGGLGDLITRGVHEVVAESKMPVSGKDYESQANFFGGSLRDIGGELVFDRTGFVSRFDIFFDKPARVFDEHILHKVPSLKRFLRNPKRYLQFLAPGPKRFKASNEQIHARIQQFGLEAVYGPHEKGVLIKKPEIFQKGIILTDIWRSDVIGNEKLQSIDRFEALASATRYVRELHERGGAGIGEVLSNDIIFQQFNPDNGEVSEPVLHIPDVIYNPKKTISVREQQATDILDFVVAMSFEEYRRTKSWDGVDQVIQTIADNYGGGEDAEAVLKLTRQLCRRGRPFLVGSFHTESYIKDGGEDGLAVTNVTDKQALESELVSRKREVKSHAMPKAIVNTLNLHNRLRLNVLSEFSDELRDHINRVMLGDFEIGEARISK